MTNSANKPIATKGLSIVFAGTPEFGLPSLQAILQSRHHLVSVYTQPDRPKGRGLSFQASPIKQWALKHHVPIHQPEHFRVVDSIEQLQQQKPDLMVVIAYGLILPQAILDSPKYGCINVHSSLLPRWRGAAPIQSAILHGDAETGVTIMQMDKGMDTGPILAMQKTPVRTDETAGQLHDRLAHLSVEPLLQVLDQIERCELIAVPQSHEQATYSSKIKKEDALIVWQEPAYKIERKIRAYYPWPVAYTHCRLERIRIIEASVEKSRLNSPGEILAITSEGMLVGTGSDALRVKQFQFSGGKVMRVRDWLNAHSPSALEGQILT